MTPINTTMTQGLVSLMLGAPDSSRQGVRSTTLDPLLEAASQVLNSASSPMKQASSVFGNAALAFAPAAVEDSSETGLVRPLTEEEAEYYASVRSEVDAIRDEIDAAIAKRDGTETWSQEARSAVKDIKDAFSQYMRVRDKIAMQDAIASLATKHGREPPPVNPGFRAYDEEIISSFGSRIGALVEALGASVAISGEVVRKGEDGTYSWGTFELRDKVTSALYLSVDDKGVMRSYDGEELFSKTWVRYGEGKSYAYGTALATSEGTDQAIADGQRASALSEAMLGAIETGAVASFTSPTRGL